MNSKVNLKNVFIKDTAISSESRLVLISLGIHTVEDLHLMYLLGTIPVVITNVSLFPFVKANLQYTEQVNEDVKKLLKVYCGLKKLEHVGAW